MNLSTYSISNVGEIIAMKEQPYFSGKELVELFNHVGIRDIYEYGRGFVGEGISSSKMSMGRKEYVKGRLKKINNTSNLNTFLKYWLILAQNKLDVNNDIMDDLITKINNIIKTDNFVIENINGQYEILGETYYEDSPVVEVQFEDIQNNIIEQLKKARFTIWVAVAWFTDPVLFDILKKKKNQGLNVQVLIVDDEINRFGGLQFEQYFETIRVPKMGVYQNIMHSKFCVIDLKTVLSGSYNWTKKAQHNYETLEVKSSRELAEEYSDEFIKLKLEYS